MSKGEYIYWVTCSHLIFRACFDQERKEYTDIKKNRVQIQKYYSEFKQSRSFSDAEREAIVRWLTEFLAKKEKHVA